MEENLEKYEHLKWMIAELEKVKYGQSNSILVAKKYQKNPEENIRERARILLKAEQDLVYREKVKRLFYTDILFAFNYFFYTLDVRKRPFSHQPFCTYPYQDITILIVLYCIENKIDIPIDKSRDMGLSWTLIGVIVWLWLNPNSYIDALLGSRIQDYVDKKGDMRTLLQKARYLIYKLPIWLRPEDFDKRRDDNFMKLINPNTGGAITGESSNPNFSTGGRYAVILYDEFAKWEYDEAAWTAGGDATPCRIPNSTPFGAAGKHFDLVTAGRLFLRLHWTLHPEKAQGAYCFFPKEKDVLDPNEGKVRSPWYDGECIRRSAIEIAQELEIDYIGAGALVFGGETSQRLRTLLRFPKDPVAYYSMDLGTETITESLVPRDDEGYLCLYEQVDPNSCYTIGVDVAEGKENGDFSEIKVFNRKSRNLSASFFSRTDEVTLAKIVKIVAKTFSFERKEWNKNEQREKIRRVNPWVVIETIGPGISTFDICALMQVPNLFMMPKYDSTTEKESLAKGWKTSSTSRNILISSIRQWLLDEQGFLDPRTVKQLTTFVYNKAKKGEAKEGCYDDAVMAFGMALAADDQLPFDYPKEKEELMWAGLENMIVHGPFKEKKDLSLEERCLETILRNKQVTTDIGMIM